MPTGYLIYHNQGPICLCVQHFVVGVLTHGHNRVVFFHKKHRLQLEERRRSPPRANLHLQCSKLRRQPTQEDLHHFFLIGNYIDGDEGITNILDSGCVIGHRQKNFRTLMSSFLSYSFLVVMLVVKIIFKFSHPPFRILPSLMQLSS